MKQRIKLGAAAAFLIIILFSSCLKKDLPGYPLWDGNYINNVYVEYRWSNSTQTYNGEPVVSYQRLQVAQQIDSLKNRIDLQVIVPEANDVFTTEARNKVNQNHLWLYMDLSTAATIRPVGNTPALGEVIDLTQPQVYEVTAANGQKRNWTITVTSFTK